MKSSTALRQRSHPGGLYGKITQLDVNEGQAVTKDASVGQTGYDNCAKRYPTDTIRFEKQSLNAAVAAALIAPLTSRDPVSEDFVEAGIQKFQRDWLSAKRK
ncbi:hypothetical protein [Rhizobium sp. NPDC090279]|uniref:hypothetical protein n=1 Tax=Rhizobium sp. NPDC090279 TaxID=3364499 RepID=UPI00383BCAF7